MSILEISKEFCRDRQTIMKIDENISWELKAKKKDLRILLTQD